MLQNLLGYKIGTNRNEINITSETGKQTRKALAEIFPSFCLK